MCYQALGSEAFSFFFLCNSSSSLSADILAGVVDTHPYALRRRLVGFMERA